ncbi:UNVERIFIED_CONTAM: esterase-like activity of phytase family protein [Prevotella sp. 15_C9]
MKEILYMGKGGKLHEYLKVLAVLIVSSIFINLFAQDKLEIKRINSQRYFTALPKGNYSGITWLGGNNYALVSDKAANSGFHLIELVLDSVSGEIINASYKGFKSSSEANHDEEGIAFYHPDSSVFIAREGDNSICEYNIQGELTGRRIQLPDFFAQASASYGIESLTYNHITGLFWTTTESTLPADGKQADTNNCLSNRLRLQSFDKNFQCFNQYYYEMDPPSTSVLARNYALGVSDLAAMDDGRLLVLEREFFVLKNKIGSFVCNKIYIVNPLRGIPIDSTKPLHENLIPIPKTLMCQWKTKLSVFHQNLANYEGMCLGPKLIDGSQVLILCADSQNQHKGILRDWFKTIIIR